MKAIPMSWDFFLSSGISGFYQNIQYMLDEYDGLTIAFPDTHITSSPLGFMVESAFEWAEQGDDFAQIQEKLAIQIADNSAFIIVDDLDHLVKGGRLSNGAAILGNLFSIKPILYFNDQGVIEVYEKVRTEKKAIKRFGGNHQGVDKRWELPYNSHSWERSSKRQRIYVSFDGEWCEF